MNFSLSHRGPLYLQERRGGASSWGDSGGRGDLAAWISSKKDWPGAQPGVLQGPVEAPWEGGQVWTRVETWKMKMFLSYFC